MRRLLPLLFALGCACDAQAVVPADLGQHVFDGYIHPATTTLEAATAGLEAALDAYCTDAASAARRAQVEQRYAGVVAAWAQVEVLRFGPLVDDNRFERFFFFPDPRGVTLRQVQGLLAGAEPQRIDTDVLRTGSVALQGLPALEYALYGSGAATQIADATPSGRYRCAYAQAIGANLHALAAELRAAWAVDAPLARQFAEPGPTRSLYRSPQEVATEVLKALSTALQYARDAKLLPALGPDAGSARAQRAPLWRSDLTASSMAAGIAGVRALYHASGFDAALAEDDRWIGANIDAEAATAIADFEAVTLPFERAVIDTDARARLVHAAMVIKNLQSIVVEYLAPALGVNLGFNALDGD